jgi:CBS domain-containing protein
MASRFQTFHHGEEIMMTLSTILRTEARLTLHADTASDLMVPNPISLRAEAKVAEAMLLFTEKGITAAPVIDDSGRPVGVISRTDLLIHQCEDQKQRDGAYFHASSFECVDAILKLSATMNVADLMTPAVFAVSEDTPVHRVVSDMVGLHVHRLFVVDKDGTLVGIVTTMDVLKHLKMEE